MSTISTAKAKIIERVSALLPDHIRLTNPIDPAQNVERTLTKGWGIYLSDGAPTDRELGCSSRYYLRRAVTITIARKFFAKELDVDTKSSLEDDLYEDLNLLLKDFETSVDLNVNQVFDFKYDGDSGTELVFSDKDNFLMIRPRFVIEYHENLT